MSLRWGWDTDQGTHQPGICCLFQQRAQARPKTRQEEQRVKRLLAKNRPNSILALLARPHKMAEQGWENVCLQSTTTRTPHLPMNMSKRWLLTDKCYEHSPRSL